VTTRTAPAFLLLALLAACGKPEGNSPAAVAPPATIAAVAAPSPVAQDDAKGEHVFKGTCAMCHATGAGGAPMFKSKADWAPRVAQGKETLYGHALKGFTGSKGTMPAKGGNISLPDDDVKAGVDYMVSHAQ
jgi:cytochrome c5